MSWLVVFHGVTKVILFTAVAGKISDLPALLSCDGEHILPEHLHSDEIQYQPDGD